MIGKQRPDSCSFAAIDFETANYSRDSACAIGVAIVRDGRLTRLEDRLIRPPTQEFVFTYIHRIAWEDVRNSATFREIWRELYPLFADVDFLAAHNAPFDRGVLDACCQSHGISAPPQEFVCTLGLARSLFKLRPARLSDVCRHLRIPLNHHHAGSDAQACALIVLAAMDRGWRP